MHLRWRGLVDDDTNRRAAARRREMFRHLDTGHVCDFNLLLGKFLDLRAQCGQSFGGDAVIVRQQIQKRGQFGIDKVARRHGLALWGRKNGMASASVYAADDSLGALLRVSGRSPGLSEKRKSSGSG